MNFMDADNKKIEPPVEGKELQPPDGDEKKE